MALDPHYIPAFSIEDVLLDKDTGAPLSGGLVYFEHDNQRGILKPVYQLTGTSPNYSYIQLPNPVVLSAIGTFEDSLDNPTIPYFYPYDANLDVDLYYVRVTNSDGVEQFVRQAVPYVQTSGDTGVTSAIENELSNPQFAKVLFNTPTTLNFNTVTDQVVNIAPDWDLIVSSPGVGTVTLSIVTPTGSLNRITNPGTILNINSASLTRLTLRQRIFGSPNLWGSGYLAGTFVAKTYAGTSSTLSMKYSQSNGSVINQTIATGTLTADGLYNAFSGSVQLPASTSTNFFPSAYIDIFFDIPLSTQIDITSIMVAGTNGVSIDDLVYSQTSLARQVDHLFHYYNPQLQYKPIPSYTVGWDFPFNPAQALGTTIPASALGANKSRYIADQTIAFEEVSNVLNYTISSPNGLSIFTTGTSQFALVQYLGATQAKELLAQRMSVMIRGMTSTGTLSGTVSIYYTTDVSLPNVASGTNNSLVATMTAGKAATFNGNWTEVLRGGLGNANFTLSNVPQNMQLTGFDATAGGGSSSATFIAIVIGFNSMPSSQSVSIQFATMQAGDIATPPPPFTFSETLSSLEAYYEKSYERADAPGTVQSQNSLLSLQDAEINGASVQLLTLPFDIRWRTLKRVTPTVSIYSPDSGAVDNVRAKVYTNGVVRNGGDIQVSTNWTLGAVPTAVGSKNIYFVPSNGNAQLATAFVSTVHPFGFLTYHYVADARYGIV